MKLDTEMQKALEADGEKLRQLTGEDHGPRFGYCDHPDEEVTLTKDNTMWEGYDARCAACGHEWYITAKEYAQRHPPEPRQPAPVTDDIPF